VALIFYQDLHPGCILKVYHAGMKGEKYFAQDNFATALVEANLKARRGRL